MGNGGYLRFWSEKADISEETRAHYTYFKGNDAAAGQEETTNPKDIFAPDNKDDKFVENDESWIKFVGGKTSFFYGLSG